MHGFSGGGDGVGKQHIDRTESDDARVAELFRLASDISLKVDTDGRIRSVHTVDEQLGEEAAAWTGRLWVETATVESRPKIEQLIREARAGLGPLRREINQLSERGEIAVRFVAVPLPEGGLIALGQDLRAVARMQQRLVDSQRAMERDYLRLRSAETRYRLLFQLGSEAVLIVDAANGRVVDLNPAATSMLEATPGRIVGRPVVEFFDPADRELLQDVMASTRGGGRMEAVRVRIGSQGRPALVSGVAYRQDEGTHILVRMSALDGSPAAKAVMVLPEFPEAMVVTDLDRVVRGANRAYLDMMGFARLEQALGENLERRLGRSGAETGILFGNLREYGLIKDFGTVLRGEFGTVEEVDVTAASVHDASPGYVFLLRRTPQRSVLSGGAQDLPRSAHDLAELIGRLPLKDIVRETADVIERLCIEDALRLTNDNRAAAAQMLGVSRQSLYDKLRRYGIGDLGGDDEADTE
jgi:transcriptional regulator PpsR